MMLLLTTFTILSFLSSHLLILVCATADSYEDDSTETPTTTRGTIVIHRKIPSKFSSGGGRYSLLNNRYNRRPRKKNLDSHQLLDILGHYFDPEWMSVDEPVALSNKDSDSGATYVVRQDSWQHADLVKHLQSSNFSKELALLGGQKLIEDPVLVKSIERWLLKRAACPIRYAWEDIGNMFWPRYIKRGECASVPGTCSWPPGMHCVPSGTTTLQVLRWQCKLPKIRPARRRNFKMAKGSKEWARRVNEGEGALNLKCGWVRVPYPITSDCLCTC